MNREIYANTKSLEGPKPEVIHCYFVTSYLSLAGQGMVPGQVMLVFGLGLVTGGDRCARDAARQNRQKCLCS